ncbi:MAG: protein-L-isoaspartate O-methyltransferase, partial [Pseudomonadota bacterium]
STPRHAFAPAGHVTDAYADRLIPIPCGQVMEAPTVLATVLANSDLSKNSTVLEIGTGSGYLTALLSKLSRRVISLERYRTLAEMARANLASFGAQTAEVILTDGSSGWPPASPFRTIVSTASVERPPESWLDQLERGGTLIVPLGPAAQPQTWSCFIKDMDDTISFKPLSTTFAAPLQVGLARAL